MENKDQSPGSPIADSGVVASPPSMGMELSRPAGLDLPVAEPMAANGTASIARIESAPNVFVRFAKRADVILAVLLLFSMAGVFWLTSGDGEKQAQLSSADANYETSFIPLDEFGFDVDGLSFGDASVVINGSTQLNGGLVVTPSLQPSKPVAGQLYFDQDTNAFAYYDGTEFVSLEAPEETPAGVTSIGGLSGQVGLAGGLGIVGNQLVNAGVISVDGQSGVIVLGNGLNMTNNVLQNTGVLNIVAGTPSVTIIDNGNGEFSVGVTGAGTGTVASGGGTVGAIPMFTAAQNIEDSILSQSGGTITVTGALNVTGGLTLGTDLSVANGGTGASSLTANGVIVGNGASPLTSIAAGGPGLCLVSTAGAPAWGSCAGGGVTSLNSLTGALTIANATTGGSTITINDATTAAKGIASFNATNFSVSSGAVDTIQNINSGASPTFAGVNTNTITPGGTLTITGATANLVVQGGTGTFGTTTQPGTLAISDGSSDTVSIVVSGLAASRTYTLPDAGGPANFCLSTGNCLGGSGGANTALSNLASTNLNAALNVTSGNLNLTTTTSGNIVLNSAGTIELQDATNITGSLDVSVALDVGTANAFRVSSAGAITAATGVTSSGTITFSALNCTGNANGGALTANGSGQLVCTDDDGAAANTITGSGTNGTIPLFNGTNTITDSIITQSGTTISIAGDLTLTTDLTVANGGTGASSFTSNGVLYGNGAGALNVTAAGTSGQVLVANGSSVPTFVSFSGDVNVAANGTVTIQSNSVALTTDTTGDYVANLGSLTGLTTTGNSGEGSTPTLSVTYGSGANTAVQGNTSITCPSGTGNLSGGGGSITLGTGGACGNITITNSPTFSGTLTVQGASATFGTAAQQGSLILHDGTGITSTITGATGTSTNYNFTNPGGSVDICLSTGNCAGSGTGVTTAGGSANRLAKFTGAQAIGDSSITDNGTNVTVNGSVNLVVQGGTGTLGTSGTAGTLVISDGSSNTVSIVTAALANDRTYTLPDAGGSATFCLSSGNCLGGGGGGANTALSNLASVNINTALNATSANLDLTTTTSGNIVLNSAGTIELQDATNIGGALTVTTGGASITGNTTIATTAGNTLGLGNSTGAFTVTGSSGSTFVINGVTVDATEFNRLDGKDAALVDTNDAVNTAITGTGILGAGSIASGFGSIDTGADNITTTGTVQGTTSVLTQSLDQTSAAALNIGATTATSIVLGKNTSMTGAATFTSGTGTVLLQGNTDIAATASFATKRGTTYTTAGSADDVALSTASLYLLDTSGAAQTITGIVAGRDGQFVTLVNADAALAVTLSNNSGSSAAANRITTGTGADISIPVGGSITLVYDSASSLWRVTSGVAGGNGTCSGCANTALSNLSGVNINTALNATSANLNLTTTTSGNIVLNSAGTIELQDATNVGGTLTVSTGGLTVSAGGASITGNTTIATTAGNTLGLGNSTGALTVTGNSSSTFVINGITVDATEFNRLDGKDAALVDTNDAVNTAITGTGALGSGSITSGFGSIDTGADNITTTGTIQGTTSVLTASLDQTTGAALNIGATTATSIVLGKNTSLTGAATFTSGTGVVLLQGNADVASTVSLATRAGTTYTTAGSANDVAISTASLYLLDTSGAAQTITGIVAGRDGQHLTLVNADAALAVTLSNNSGSSTAANRITTGTGADISIPVGGSISLIYDSTSALWRVTSGVAGGACSTCANRALSNLSAVNINTALNATSANLDLTTTTSGNIVLNSAGTIELQDATNVGGTLTVSTGGLTVSAGGASITGNTTIATTGGNTLGLGNGTGAVTVTGSSGSTFVINGVTVDATEFNRLDGKDAALVDTNDAVNTAITGTGALGSGSITSGFGSIDVGADSIQGGTATLTGANALTLGTTGTSTGAILFKGSTAASGTITLIGQNNPGTQTITLPDATGTVCLQTSASCGFATGTGAAFVQGGNSFIAAATLGTNDAFDLEFETSGTTRMTLESDGSQLTFASNVDLRLQGATAFISNPQGLATSEFFGSGATFEAGSVANVTVVGAGSKAGDRSVSFGSGINNTANDSVAIGHGVSITCASAIAIGSGASACSDAIAIGDGATASANSIAIGFAATNTAANQLVIGSNDDTTHHISHVVIGSGVTDATPNGFTLQGTSGTGTDIAGASVNIAGGQGTGTGNGGSLNFQIADPGTTGTSLNTLTTVLSLSGVNGSALFQNTTDSTTGFQVQNAAGTTTVLDVNTSNGRVGINTAAPSADLTFGQGSTRQINVETRSTNAGGNALILAGGAAGAGANGQAGGDVTVKGGAAAGTSGGANGGHVYLQGGAAVNGGAAGSVIVRNTADSATAFQVQNAAGATVVLDVDTSNGRVGINTAAPSERLTVNGNFNIRDADTPTKQYRFRTSGGNLDIDGAGAQLFLSVFQNGDFTGTQREYLVLENGAHIAQAIGTWQWRTAGNGTTRHSISSLTGGNVVFNDNSEATNFTIEGDNDANALFLQGSSDRLGVGTNAPAAKLHVSSAAAEPLFRVTDGTAAAVDVLNVADEGAVTLKNRTNSGAAFSVQDTASASLLLVDTAARSGSGGNLVKIGNSTGTDADLTILQLDASAGDPSSNLSALNGGLFYNSSTGKLSIIEGNAVKVLCNKTDLACGAGATTPLQTAYNDDVNGSDAIVALTTDDDSIIFRNPSSGGTDSGYVFSVDQLNTGTVDGFRLNTVGTGVGQLITLANTTGTMTNGLLVDRNGSGGTTTNGINITQTAGTLTNGLAFTGTIGTDIQRASGTLTMQGAGGVTITAGTTNSVLIDSAGAGTVGLGATNATTINIGSSAPAAARAITIGGGNAGFVDTINIGTGAGTVAGAKTIHIGDGTPTGSGTNLITIGSIAALANTTTIQGGNGSGAISVQAASSGTISVGTTNSNVITLGSTGSTSNITVGQSTASQTIAIGSGTTAAGNTLTVNVATSATSTGKALVTIGNTNDGSALTLQGGTGNVNLTVGAGTVASATKIVGSGGTFQMTGPSGVSSGATTMTASSGASTFSTSVSLTLNAGDYIIPTTTTAQARVVTATATGTSFSVSPVFSGAVSAETFNIHRSIANFLTNAGATGITVQGSTGNIGIGTAAPIRPLHVATNNSTTNAPTLLVDQAGSGDSSIEFKDANGKSYYFGIDASEGSLLRLSSSTSANTVTNVGTTSDGGSAQGGYSGQFVAKKVTTGGSGGTAVSISFRTEAVDGTNAGAKVALYSHDAGNDRPNTLLDYIDVEQDLVLGLNTFSISTPVSASTVYWIAVHPEGNGTTLDYTFCSGCGGRSAVYNKTYTTSWTGSSPAGAPVAFSTNEDWSFYFSQVPTGAVDSFAGTNLLTIGDSGITTFRNSSNSPTAFRVLNASAVPQFGVDTSNSRVYIGNPTADTTGALLVLDTKNSASDPTGVAGAMYYNSKYDSFRCYELTMWRDCIGTPKPNSRRTFNARADGTASTFSISGDAANQTNVGSPTVAASAATTTNPSAITYQSGATSGDEVQIAGNTNYDFDTSPIYQSYVSISATTSVRFWAGLTNLTAAGMFGSDSPTGRYAAFRYSTNASDTNWKCVTDDNNANANVVDSGIAISTAYTRLEIFVDNANSQVIFKINNQEVCNTATRYPGAGNLARYVNGIETLTGSSRTMGVAWIYVESDQ